MLANAEQRGSAQIQFVILPEGTLYASSKCVNLFLESKHMLSMKNAMHCVDMKKNSFLNNTSFLHPINQ